MHAIIHVLSVSLNSNLEVAVFPDIIYMEQFGATR